MSGISTILTLEAARALQWKHGKLMRDLDRLAAMLPPETARRYFKPVRVTVKGKEKRAFCLDGKAWPLLFLRNATTVELRFAVAILEGLYQPQSNTGENICNDVFARAGGRAYGVRSALCVTGSTVSSSGQQSDGVHHD